MSYHQWHRNRNNEDDYHFDFHMFFTTRNRFMSRAVHEKLKEGFTNVQRRIDHFVTVRGYYLDQQHRVLWPRLAYYFSLRFQYAMVLRFICMHIGCERNVNIAKDMILKISEMEDEIYGKSFSAWEFVRNLFTGRCG